MDQNHTPIIDFISNNNKILQQICFELFGKTDEYPELKPELGSYVKYVISCLYNLRNTNIEKEYKLISKKSVATKKRWYKQVINYYEQNNSTKYILHEQNKLKSLIKLSSDLLSDRKDLEEQIENLYSRRMQILENWVSSGMLHEFHYIDDLQVNQRKLILEVDTYHILLEELKNSKELLHVVDDLDSGYNSVEDKQYGGQMPDALVSVDGIFRVSKPKDDQIQTFGDEIFIENETQQMKYTLTAPMLFQDNESSLEIDYINERNYLTAYEQKVLVSILQLGRKQIQFGNKIKFSKNQVLNLLNLSSGGKNYALIEKYMYNLFNFRHTVEYRDSKGESRLFSFVIFQSIDRPTDEDMNSLGEKEWTVTLNSDLHNQILERNFIDVFAEELRDLRSETAMILLPYFASDRLKSFRRINSRGKENYSVIKLIEKSGLGNNKPSKLLLKLEDALQELKQKQICIKDFSRKGVGKNAKLYIHFLEN